MDYVLVDSSAWIDFFKFPQSIYAQVLDQLLDSNQVCICGLVLAEIVPSVRTEQQVEDLKSYFYALKILPDPVDLWNKIIKLQFLLKKRGVNGMSIPDLIIALTAHESDVRILTKDRDFLQIQKVISINIYTPQK